MFFHADNRKARSGLGLYIVKETVEKLGGKIQLDSEFEKGSTFRLVIPNAGAPIAITQPATGAE